MFVLYHQDSTTTRYSNSDQDTTTTRYSNSDQDSGIWWDSGHHNTQMMPTSSLTSQDPAKEKSHGNII